MRRYWLVGIVCIAVFSIFGYSAPAQEIKGPKMVLKEREFDFKDVKEGKAIRHTFHVLNQGDETLRIIKVRPG
ncbi:MAG: DUF1573 domain-containing protein [Deltaproteobacteria bacterium]|nr:DUF1573 domain-containing protein [Deltaproteobacteria bacterium]MBW1736848.1 DUF1573 domain-containing protein [Deltaproteobacteria bacterium]MBW1910344.1 DUF1573 domain-containing protein [Deltaproteobacteria bacterium]MBW2032995.1 DUF1573 domain-containing protein [Deltaproteobacteria bacterium]MBW2114737.1 DUF1573 domain-containing protein [Deltaproteobacteria bacterium]